jgi:8-oxo-dGTP pyrophosphatase MutT (NUDIX family)
MQEPSLEYLNGLRKQGMRPGFVGLIVKNKKVMFLYQMKYDLWGFPQGGIQNKETPMEAILRVSKEELGEEFAEYFDMRCECLGEDRIEFRPEKSEGQDLHDDEGNKIRMIGKHYFFYLISCQEEKIDLTKSIYTHARWADYVESQNLITKIYQQGKQRITKKAIELLREKGSI